MVFEVKEHQQVAIASGSGVFVFALPDYQQQ